MLKLRGIVWGMVVAGVLGAGAARGQEETPAPRAAQPGSARGTQPTPSPQFQQPAAPEFVLTVDFPGGTVGQYVEMLKKSAGRNVVNVVMSRSAMEVPIGPISMRDVSLYTALSAIQAAAGRETQWRVQPLISNTSRVVEAFSMEYVQSQQQTVFMGTPKPQADATGIKVFSIRNLIDAMPGDPSGVKLTKTPEVVLTAVRAALDLAGNADTPPEMKYHEDSGLLIIHGNNDQVGAVSQTLGEMETDVKRRREMARTFTGPNVDVLELQTSIKKLEVMQGQKMRELDRAQDSAERARKLLEAGQMSQGDYAEAAAKLDEAKSQMQLGTIDLERAKAAYAEAMKGSGNGREERKDELEARLVAMGDMVKRMQMQMEKAKMDGGHEDQVASLRKQVDDLSAQRNQAMVELDTLRQLEVIEEMKTRKGRPQADPTDQAAPAGKSVMIYDLPQMDAKAKERLITAIKGMEAAINNPERLKFQSVQGDSKLVIEADGAMHSVVRGMLKEVSGASGGEPDKPGKDGKAKPGR